MTLARTPLAAFGVVLTTACALLFLLALGAESFGLIENPYVGILIFFALPAGFLLGLLLVAVGNLRGRRRGAEADRLADDRPQESRPAHLHHGAARGLARQRRHPVDGRRRRRALHGDAGVLRPGLPHGHGARIRRRTRRGRTPTSPASAATSARAPARSCSRRSTAPGGWSASSPATSRGPSRRRSTAMRPARETCGTCHWPEKIHGDQLKVVKEYADDEAGQRDGDHARDEGRRRQHRARHRRGHPLAHERRRTRSSTSPSTTSARTSPTSSSRRPTARCASSASPA